MNKIQKFIKNNNLSLDGSSSNLNSTCCIIAGYALYESADTNNFEKLLQDIKEDDLHDLTLEFEIELERVYDFAYRSNYYMWWEQDDNRKKYIVEVEE
jgi:hypothetical protein